MHSSDSSRKRKDSTADDADIHVQQIPEQGVSVRTRPPPRPPRKWQVWEDVRLIVAARRNSLSKWKHVAREVGNNRNHMQVLQRWKAVIEPAFFGVKWSQAEDALLRSETTDLLASRGILTAINWRQLAARLPFRSGPEVEAHWYNYIADSEQKLDYATRTERRTYENDAALLEQDGAPPPLAAVAPDKIDNDILPTPPPPRQRSLEPNVISSQQHENLREQMILEQQTKESAAAAAADGSQLGISSPVDAFDYVSSPLSSREEAELYDDIKDYLDIPYSHHFESFMSSSAESKQNRNGNEAEYLKQIESEEEQCKQS